MRMYYSVISKCMPGEKWAIQFGDYDKEVAQDEMQYMKESGEYKALKIIRTGDKQAAIEAEVNRLNNWAIKG